MSMFKPVLTIAGLSAIASSAALADSATSACAPLRPSQPSAQERAQADGRAATIDDVLANLSGMDKAVMSKRPSSIGAFDAYVCPEGLKALATTLPFTLEAILPDRPDLSVGRLRVEQLISIGDDHPDHAPLLLADSMLGQTTTSRLWTRLREKEGLAYEVESSIRWNVSDGKSLWALTASFPPEHQDKLQAVLLDEMNRIRASGFTEGELQDAKVGLMKYRQLWRTQIMWAAGNSARAQGPSRDPASAQKLDEKLGSVTLEQVNTALRRHLLAPAQWAPTFSPPLVRR